jgi:acetyl-CoA carboxylase biotin carboxyl carrier protein
MQVMLDQVVFGTMAPFRCKRKATTMKQVTAMMAGTVIEILVKTGDQVSDGQDVIILESMKMQLPVQAEQSGTVKEVKVGSGDFVNEGDTILVLE